MKIEDSDQRLELRFQALGDVIAGALPSSPRGAEGPLPEHLERAAAGRRPERRRRALWLWIPALAAIVALVVMRNRPLRYELEGARASADDRFETAARSGATVRFSDGTSIAVGQQSAGRIKSRTPVGATFQLERGRAAFAVVHRPSADWRVEAGPFEIAVTGTQFEVRWSDDRDGFEVVMKSGATVVRGSLAGAGIPLHAGQRLIASLSRRTLVVNEITGEPRQADAPPPPAPTSSAAAEGVLRARRDRAAPPGRGAKRGLAMAERAIAGRAIAPAPAWDPAVEAAPPPAEPLPEPLPDPPKALPAPAPPVLAAPPPRPSPFNAGGAACDDRNPPQLPFERLAEGFGASGGQASAFSSPSLDHSRSWCGHGALKFEADFNFSGTPNWFGELPSQAGEAIVVLPTPVDLTRKTVVVHFYVDGPEDAEFNARILAVAAGKRIGDTYTPSLYPGRWWTISSNFQGKPSRVFEFGNSGVEGTRRLILKIDATGTRRTWTGAIYIDDISWH